MTNQRRIALLIAILALGVFAWSAYELSRFVRNYNRDNPPPIYYFYPIGISEFEYAGQRATIRDEITELGTGLVNINYADESISIPVGVPLTEAERLIPGIAKHQSWLRIALKREESSFDADRMRALEDQKKLEGDLVVIARRPSPGADPETFGQMSRDWTFEFHTFLPEGGFKTERLVYPESVRAFNKRKKEAAAKGEPVPTRRDDELKEGSWQFAGAMSVMPPSSTPKHLFTQNALVFAGWRWPVAGFSITIFAVALAWAFAPRRTTANNRA